MPPDPINHDADHAEAAAIERATGAEVRAALRPYLDHLREIHPAGYASLISQTVTAYGSEWLDAFRAPVRFGWRGKRWPAPLTNEIIRIVNDLDNLEAAAFRAYHGFTPEPTKEP